MANWANFYMLIGTSAATLMGLMFIAVTFGSKLVTAETVDLAKSFSSPIIYHFMHAFFVACAALIPDVGPMAVAISAIVTAIFRLFTLPPVFRHLKVASQKYGDIETSDWLINFLIPLALYLASLVSGTFLLADAAWAYFGVALSLIGLLILGVLGAWETLVWMVSKV